MPEADFGADVPNNLTGEAGQYETTLQAMAFPVGFHALFNAWAAAAILLLGHPSIAASSFAIAVGADAVQQRLVRRWQKTAGEVGDRAGMVRLSVFVALRMSLTMIPLAVMVIQGGLPEIFLAGITLISLLAIGQAMGALSRLLFWAYIGPALVALGIVTAVRLPFSQSAGVLVALAYCFAVMWILSTNTNQIVAAWRDEFAAKKQAVAEMEAARDEARRANRAKSNFLATMSHEIRTPMNGVLGMAQLLKRDEADPAQAERLQVLIDSGEYLLTILNDILDVSKIDAGKLEIAPAPEALAPFLERVVGFWGARADECGVSLKLRIAQGAPAAVMVDGLRLRQVLFNLIGNALKFTEAGCVELLADATPEGDGRVRLRLTVRDTGPGIGAEHLPALFDRFSQVDDGEVRRFGGTGLGLAIVKQLVELMEGRVWVESALGVGSSFHVELPLALAQAPALERAPAADLPAEPAALEPLRVLAIDDNAVNLLVLAQLLNSLGQTVVKAGSGAEALALLAVETFDLVLTDIQMPGMTGIEVLQALRATPGPNQAAPVVALTADVTSGGRQRYLDLGFTEHTAKPIQLQDLLGAIARAVAEPEPPVARVA